MIRFLRRIFGGHGPSIYANDSNDGDAEYDAETQEMILSSFDLIEHLQAKGENLENERAISHFFVGEDQDIQRAADLFESWGFLIGMQEDNRLQIVERAVLSNVWIKHVIPLICRTAGEFDLDYNGWDCGRTLGPNDQLFIR